MITGGPNGVSAVRGQLMLKERQQAAETIRQAVDGAGKLVTTSLVVSVSALLIAGIALLIAVRKGD
jgi:hypothetical protein